MNYLSRFLDLKTLLAKKSLFLLGPRSTGKSSMIRNQLIPDVSIDLLRGDAYLLLSREPWKLEPLVLNQSKSPNLIVIDEIQRIPELLNEVHRLIEEKHWIFLMTGSSAKKLRQKGVNLLAGRAWEARMCPLIMSEIPQFDLNRYLLVGGLPNVYLSEFPDEELFAYVNTYLREEIQSEASVRKIPAFSRFLELAALTSGHVVNYSSIASDSGVPVSTIRLYYQLLEDTLLGFFLPPWQHSVKRKPVATPKFYFFDIGVRNAIVGRRQIEPHSVEYGDAFEHFIAMELRAYLFYRRVRDPLTYWRTKNGNEVDFIVGDHMGIEVKSTQRVTHRHLGGLNALSEEGICQWLILVSHDSLNRTELGIECLHWQAFLTRLWQGDFGI